MFYTYCRDLINFISSSVNAESLNEYVDSSFRAVIVELLNSFHRNVIDDGIDSSANG